MANNALRTADELLVFASHAVDYVVELLSSSADGSLRGQARTLAVAMASMFEVQNAIYAAQPNLKPEWLSRPSPDPQASRAYGHLLIESRDLWERGDGKAAVDLVKSYLSAQPNDMFCELAARYLEFLETALSSPDDV